MIRDLSERALHILKLVVDSYVETGTPVGSVALSQKPGMRLSPATIRHAMAELEERGLLYSRHTSAGRLPTESGLKVFVEGLLEADALLPEDRRRIDQKMRQVEGGAVMEALDHMGSLLSGLSSGAGLVFVPKTEEAIRHLEFVLLSPGRVLAILVTTRGTVENRLFDLPLSVTASMLLQVSNYLNSRLAYKTLAEAQETIQREVAEDQAQLDALAAKVVHSGLASFAPQEKGGHLFIKGQSRLLEDVSAVEDLERIRGLFEALETKETMLSLLQEACSAEGIKIFIGAENQLFNHSGCALIAAPYKNPQTQMVGAIGVIGPSRMDYRRVIPVVNYASLLLGKFV